MARKSTHTFVQSKMNKDLDARLLEAGQYRDAKNVAVSRSDSDDVGALENILGNELLQQMPSNFFVNSPNPALALPIKVGNVKAIGWCFNIDRDEIFIFVTNNNDESSFLTEPSQFAAITETQASPTTYHAILVYSEKENTITTLVEGSFLNFSINNPILDPEMIEDLLFFTDNRNQPRKINTKIKEIDPSFEYTNEDQISVAKPYPFKCMETLQEIELEALYINKDEAHPTQTDNRIYKEAYYNFFVLKDDPSQEIIDLLFMNIGLDGCIESGQYDQGFPDLFPGTYTFKLAFFQQDGWIPAGFYSAEYQNLNASAYPAVANRTGAQFIVPDPPPSSFPRLPDTLSGKWVLFIDRDFRPFVGATTSYSDVGTANEKLLKIKFKIPKALNVTDPWRPDNQITMSANQVNVYSPGTQSVYSEIRYSQTGSPGTVNTLPAIFSWNAYMFGTRSCGFDLNTFQPNMPANQFPTPAGTDFTVAPFVDGIPTNATSAMDRWANGPVFKIDNLFSKNQGLASHGWMRLVSPKIPKDEIIIVTNIKASYSPGTNFWKFNIAVNRLTGLVNGEIKSIDLKEEYGMVDDDPFSIQWPNKYYDSEFVGNSNFTEDKFIRFAYRYRFIDGEYSIMSPFTQNVFIPKQDGYFLKTPGKTTIQGGDQNLIPQIQTAGQNTIVEFFENKVNRVDLRIPTGLTAEEMKFNLHVKEIDILYKESEAMAVRVLKTIDINDIIIDPNISSDKFITYVYNSEEPIKTLDSKEIARVYDNVPVKAKTQAVSGNRIIYANFLDKHTSPLQMNYGVGVSAKYPASFKNSSGAYYSYPNSTLKQNRNYQVGIILSDKYGRSSDVILSNEEINFDKNTSNQKGDWANNPIKFGSSTVYSNYFDSVYSLFNSNNGGGGGTFLNPSSINPTISDFYDKTPSPNSGIVNWKGDSLKIGFTGGKVVPSTLSYQANGLPSRPGYPGIYRDNDIFFGRLDVRSCLAFDASGDIITTTNTAYLDPSYRIMQLIVGAVQGQLSASVGDVIDFDFSEVVEPDPNIGKVGEAVILSKESSVDGITGRYRLICAMKVTDVSDPTNVVTFTLNNGYDIRCPFFDPIKPTGWYSYRVVVKQKEQDYYNVYLPSLLKGNPIPKPFKLFIELIDAAEFPNGTKILTIDNTKHPIPQTFPILEGMMLTLENDKKFYVSNILNDTQFEVTTIVTSSDITDQTVGGSQTTNEYEFEALSNGTTLNCATMLTDNANKVPPSLNEVTPVQQQFSTSTIRLIPRVALPGDKVRVNWRSDEFVGDLITASSSAYNYDNLPQSEFGSWTFPIYPIKGESVKVRSVGNFENLFVDGKYNGLFEANTNPPTGIYENSFNIGRQAETAKPSNEEMYQEAVYETTPTVSNLEIYYETSTSGLVSDLNNISALNETVEVDYYNSYWLKRIKVLNPQSQISNIAVAKFDFGDNDNQKSFGGRGVGSSPALGVFPLSSCFAAPLNLSALGSPQNVNSTTSKMPMLVHNSSSSSEPTFIRISQTGSQSDYNFYLEESRLRGGYNNAQTDLGARAFLDQDNPTQQDRFNSLIYSGVFNSRTGVNRTNEFPTGEVLTRSANPENGSIQKIYSEEGNLLVLQENKCNRALIDKDTIYTSEGGTQTQAAGTVVGQITPYKGSYGISKNPESFGIYGFRKYFADVNRGCMLRLSHDGLTEVSEYGMRDYFRDSLSNIDNNYNREFEIELDSGLFEDKAIDALNQTYLVVNGNNVNAINYIMDNVTIGSLVKLQFNTYAPTLLLIAMSRSAFASSQKDLCLYFNGAVEFDSADDSAPDISIVSKLRSNIVGGWDIYNKQYVTSLQYNYSSKVTVTTDETPTTSRDFTFDTLSFDEQISGWPSFYDYRPGLIGSIKNNYYTINNDSIFTGGSNNNNGFGNGKFGIYKQFSEAGGNNRAKFYGTFYPSHVTIIANQSPSSQKTFTAIDYEGSNGWYTSIIVSDETGKDNGLMYTDQATVILSYNSTYVDAVTGYTLRPGFDRKDNRYVANLVNKSEPMPGEIIFGNKMTGIKGYYAEVKLEDDLQNTGQMLELYQVGMSYNITAT